ncbi:Hypothetical predicted protein [Marmota monax]|uniref:Uncharacterized protein n=1 Tax=Marmota monax TaxID=9995 RepID=A0A5E4BRV1_MARMO|nr:Hypothetical predicted protein [Marmota monax]
MAAPFNQVPDEQEVDHESWERSPELWAPQDADLQLIRSRPSGPARPYGLSRAVGDYQYAPKPKHRRPDRLLSLLGASYDPFWMTEEEPHAWSATAASWPGRSPSCGCLHCGCQHQQRRLGAVGGCEHSAPLAGGPRFLWPHLVLGRSGPRFLAPLGPPHRLQCVASCLFLAAWHDLPACTAHAHQAAGLALLGESQATTRPGTPPAAVRMAPGALPRSGGLQVFLPLMWPHLPALPPDPLGHHDLLHDCSRPKLLRIVGYNAPNLNFKHPQDPARAPPGLEVPES